MADESQRALWLLLGVVDRGWVGRGVILRKGTRGRTGGSTFLESANVVEIGCWAALIWFG